MCLKRGLHSSHEQLISTTLLRDMESYLRALSNKNRSLYQSVFYYSVCYLCKMYICCFNKNLSLYNIFIGYIVCLQIHLIIPCPNQTCEWIAQMITSIQLLFYSPTKYSLNKAFGGFTFRFPSPRVDSKFTLN